MTDDIIYYETKDSGCKRRIVTFLGEFDDMSCRHYDHQYNFCDIHDAAIKDFTPCSKCKGKDWK